MSNDLIKRNAELHDRIASVYDDIHSEIFNDVEQRRLSTTLRRALSYVQSTAAKPRAFDFGCGTGNLTRHLIEMGVDVVAGDVSQKCLQIVVNKFGVKTFLLNGNDLSEIDSETFDFVACYSVLHHIPDYMKAIYELGRICKNGGIVYIDHEPTDEYWIFSEQYSRFRKCAEKINYRKFLHLSNYFNKFRRMINSRYTNEGDIHVWPDDHVEWDHIINLFCKTSFRIVIDEKFLLCRANYRSDVFEYFKNNIADTRAMAFKKF